MPAELNQVFLIGNLTADPEIRYLDSGTAVCDLRLASNTSYSDRSGESQQDTCFVDVETWERLAENCHRFLRKGSKVLATGRLRFRTWETDTGEKRSRHSIRAQTVQFLDPPSGARGADAEGGPANNGAAGGEAPRTDDEDDIPF